MRIAALSEARSKDVMAVGLALARLAEHRRGSRQRLDLALESLDRGHSKLSLFHAVTAAQLIRGGRGVDVRVVLAAAEGSRRLMEVSLEQARGAVPAIYLDRFDALTQDSLRLAAEAVAMLRFMAWDPSLLEHGERRFKLREPLDVKVGRGPGGWTLDAELLELHEYGETFDEAWEAFRAHFAADWDEIALAPDERLTADAQELKTTLLAAVEQLSP